jgi:hypothetical protein
MQEGSLTKTMEKVLQRMKNADSGAVKNKKISRPLTELDAYSIVDPVLNKLRKRYLEAKTQFEDLVELRGADDPMSEAAKDWKESEESAIETRLIELRRKNAVRVQASLLLKMAKEEAEEANKKASLAYKKKMEDFNSDVKSKEKLLKMAEEGAFNIAILMMLLGMVIEHTKQVFSLASTFSDVSVAENKQAA